MRPMLAEAAPQFGGSSGSGGDTWQADPGLVALMANFDSTITAPLEAAQNNVDELFPQWTDPQAEARCEAVFDELFDPAPEAETKCDWGTRQRVNKADANRGEQ